VGGRRTRWGRGRRGEVKGVDQKSVDSRDECNWAALRGDVCVCVCVCVWIFIARIALWFRFCVPAAAVKKYIQRRGTHARVSLTLFVLVFFLCYYYYCILSWHVCVCVCVCMDVWM
jgi:hypothetical protein